MNKEQINKKLKNLYARHLKSLDRDELLSITKEVLYLKIGLGLLKRYRKQKFSDLPEEWFDKHSKNFLFGTAHIYPPYGDSETVVLMTDFYGKSVDLIRAVVADVSPFLSEAEVMLFKVAFCEEHFQVEKVEDKKKKQKASRKSP